jgi:O-methyltransferase
VFRGSTFIHSYNIYKYFHDENVANLKNTQKWRKEVSQILSNYYPLFHGLDTFEGIPDNNEESISYAGSTYFASQEEVIDRFKEEGIDNYHLYKGLFSETIDELNKCCKKAAIVNIDGDLYSSAVDTLNSVKPLIQNGTVLLFDDYNAFMASNNKGERKAFLEFQESFNGTFEPWFSYMILGQSFICVEAGSENPD